MCVWVAENDHIVLRYRCTAVLKFISIWYLSTADIKVVNWAIFKHKGFILACFANTGVSFSSSVIVIHLSAYAQFDVGISPQRAAVLLSLIGIMGKSGQFRIHELIRGLWVRISYALWTKLLLLIFSNSSNTQNIYSTINQWALWEWDPEQVSLT